MFLERHGLRNPDYDALYQEQGTSIDPEERKEIVWEMQHMMLRRPGLHPAHEPRLHRRALATEWAGFQTELNAYSKQLDAPHLVG